MKYAQFEIGNGITVAYGEDRGKYSNSPRVSDWVEVDFPPRPQEEIIPEKLEALAELETALRNQFQEKLDQINGERANLLALTNKVQP